MARTNGNTPAVELEIEDMPLTFNVAGQEFNTTWREIPFMNRVNMVRKVVKHKLSNEAYAAARNDEAVIAAAGLTKEMTKDEVKAALDAWRQAGGQEDWNAALYFQSNKLWNLILEEGGVTESDRPRGDSFDAELMKLVDKALRAEFAGKKDASGKAFKLPTNDNDSMEFADGEKWSRAELRAFILNRDGEQLRTQAQTIINNRQVAPTTTPTVEAVTSAASMGFTKVA